jgi:hypothetical protein
MVVAEVAVAAPNRAPGSGRPPSTVGCEPKASSVAASRLRLRLAQKRVEPRRRTRRQSPHGPHRLPIGPSVGVEVEPAVLSHPSPGLEPTSDVSRDVTIEAHWSAGAVAGEDVRLGIPEVVAQFGARFVTVEQRVVE